MRFLKNLAGIFVGKIVLRAQLIPIGRLYGLKYLWAKLFISRAEIERVNSLWPSFLAKNKKNESEAPELCVEVKRELIPRPHGVVLDTIELSDKAKDPTEYVIYGWGRNDCYEFNLSRLASDALNLNKRIVSFNFRGVCHSVGQVYNEHDLINDYLFQVQRLLEKGIPPQNIKCYGHSLCAAVATFALDDLIRRHSTLKFYNDRSFASLVETSVRLYFKRQNSRYRIVTTGATTLLVLTIGTAVTVGTLSLLSSTFILGIGAMSIYWPVTHKLYDKTFGKLFETAMIKTMRYGGWELKAAQVYDRIPLENKTHTVIKRPTKESSPLLGPRDVKEPADDRVILYEHSLHRHLPEYLGVRKSLKSALVVAIEKNQDDKIAELKEELIRLSNVKMTGGGHMTDPKEFVTRYKSGLINQSITGQQRFYDFVEPNGGHTKTDPKNYKIF